MGSEDTLPAQTLILLAKPACSWSKGVSLSSSDIPITPFKGVRSSCDTFARNTKTKISSNHSASINVQDTSKLKHHLLLFAFAASSLSLTFSIASASATLALSSASLALPSASFC